MYVIYNVCKVEYSGMHKQCVNNKVKNTVFGSSLNLLQHQQ